MVAQVVTGRQFNDDGLGRAFDALVTLHQAGRPVNDSMLVVRELTAMGISNGPELVKIAREIPHIAHAVYYSEIVRDLSRLRGMKDAAGRLLEEIDQPDSKPDGVLAWLESEMLSLRHGTVSSARAIGEVWDAVLERLQGFVGSGRRQVLMSGLPAADNLGFVFSPGELTVLAARPGNGKTTLATQIAMHHATRGRTVLMASLEMKDEELGSRLLVAAGGYNHHHIRTGQIDQECVDNLRQARTELGDHPFFVWSPGRVKCGAIHAAASVFKATNNLEMLVVDFIGLVKADDPGRQRYEQVGQVTKGLRDIAQHLGIPVLALCQLNREGGKQRPTLMNLKESGAIEEDADIVAFLHPSSRGQTELIVEKNRQGAQGSVGLTWHPEETRFSDSSGGTEWKPLEQQDAKEELF